MHLPSYLRVGARVHLPYLKSRHCPLCICVLSSPPTALGEACVLCPAGHQSSRGYVCILCPAGHQSCRKHVCILCPAEHHPSGGTEKFRIHLWLSEWLLLPSPQFLNSVFLGVGSSRMDWEALLGELSYSAILRYICSLYYRKKSLDIWYY